MTDELTIEEFIEARLQDLEDVIGLYVRGDLPRQWLNELIGAIRDVLDFHKKFPTLAQGPPVFSQATFNPEENPDEIIFRVVQHAEWLTREEFVKKYGDTAPSWYVIKRLAAKWADHPDYREEWM